MGKASAILPPLASFMRTLALLLFLASAISHADQQQKRYIFFVRPIQQKDMDSVVHHVPQEDELRIKQLKQTTGASRVALQARPSHSRDGAPQRSVEGLLVAEPAENPPLSAGEHVLAPIAMDLSCAEHLTSLLQAPS